MSIRLVFLCVFIFNILEAKSLDFKIYFLDSSFQNELSLLDTTEIYNQEPEVNNENQ